MFELLLVMLGFAAGYGVRDYISRRHRRRVKRERRSSEQATRRHAKDVLGSPGKPKIDEREP